MLMILYKTSSLNLQSSTNIKQHLYRVHAPQLCDCCEVTSDPIGLETHKPSGQRVRTQNNMKHLN